MAASLSAIAGKLSEPAVLEQQTRRMLSDPKSNALIDNFATEWMRLRELENAEPESADFDGNLRQGFQREIQLFFESIVREDRVERRAGPLPGVGTRFTERFGEYRRPLCKLIFASDQTAVEIHCCSFCFGAALYRSMSS